jgi:hypothetical protein
MKRKRVWLAAVVVVIAVLAVWFEPTGAVRGWLRGEAFYLGRPTSYWGRELARWSAHGSFVGDFLFPLADIDGRINANTQFVVTVPPLAARGPQDNTRDLATALWIDLQVGGYTREPTLLERAADAVGWELERPTQPPLLDGDPAAEPVLRELLDDPADSVREIARRGLRRIRPDAARMELWNELSITRAPE